MELGNHEFKPEKETLRDFVIREYKDRAEGLKPNRFQEMRDAIREVGSTQSCPRSIIMSNDLKGWALRTRKMERFSKKIVDYLNAKFDEGIQDPRKKWRPDTVAQAMRNDMQFDASEFLSTQQIAAYFSRIAKQRENQPRTSPEVPRNAADGEDDEEQIDEPNDFEEHPPEKDNIDEMVNEIRTAESNGN